MLTTILRGLGKDIGADIALSWGWKSKRVVILVVGHVWDYSVSNHIKSSNFSSNL